MEKHINVTIEEYTTKMKEEIKNKIISLNLENTAIAADLIQFTFDYPRLTLNKNDFMKRKRVQNSIPEVNRCLACRASGEQCTRRRKEESEFCGTHTKGTPHGLVQINTETKTIHKIDVFAEEINGIVYYIDTNKNVYKTEDILKEKEDPEIIAHWEKRGNTYIIPGFGLI